MPTYYEKWLTYCRDHGIKISDSEEGRAWDFANWMHEHFLYAFKSVPKPADEERRKPEPAPASAVCADCGELREHFRHGTAPKRGLKGFDTAYLYHPFQPERP